MFNQSALRNAILASLDGAASCQSGLAPMGVFEVYINGELAEVAPNLVPAAARSYGLRAMVAGGPQVSQWYGAPFINDVAPTSALTAANFEATLDEFTNYTEANRPLWAQDVEANQAVENGSTLMQFTIGAGGGTISGIALLSNSIKGNATGTLLAATQFADPRVLQAGDVLEFKYRLQANAA